MQTEKLAIFKGGTWRNVHCMRVCKILRGGEFVTDFDSRSGTNNVRAHEERYVGWRARNV